MYIYIYIYICIYVLYAYIYTHIYIYICICIYVLYAYIYTHIYMCIYICIYLKGDIKEKATFGRQHIYFPKLCTFSKIKALTQSTLMVTNFWYSFGVF